MPESSTYKSPPPLELLGYKLPPKLGRSVREQRSRSLLLRALEQGTTVAFLGAGISRPFGYPDWKTLGFAVLGRTLGELEKLADTDSRVAACRDYIQSLKTGAEGLGDELEANALMFMIGACKTALDLARKDLVDSVYYDVFRSEFEKAPCPENDNAFAALLGLPIHRFVTTNYDWEIEKALAKIRKDLVKLEHFCLGATVESEHYPRRLSLTQKPGDLDRLALFALARARGNENMVFHCHGRFDDPRLIVATEADYQHWYLSREVDASSAFQQNVELLLGSNPLLFIGYSLRDDDLLRPLRQLGVLDPARKDLQPIFALLECSPENAEKDLYYYEVLFERYGLHVIHYRRGSMTQTQGLQAALEALREDLKEAHRKWSEKPFLKRPGRLSEQSKRYCEIDEPTEVPVKALARLEEEIRRPGIVVLLGPSGSGKSRYALELSGQEFSKTFYWNAHYGNEAVTALDYALAYFDPKRKTKGSRYERVCECLRRNRFLFILDGCERLLRRGENPREGMTYSITFRRLLKAFANPQNLSTVVLATRLWPVDLDPLRREHEGQPIIRTLFLSRLEAEDLAKSEPFASMRTSEDPERVLKVKTEISALCSLLRGHNYGLFLAGRYLEKSNEDPLRALEKLNRSLADRHRDERLQEMVHQQVLQVDRNQGDGPARALLDKLVTFLGPVCQETLEICFKEACAKLDHSCPPPIQELIDAGLLFQMRPPGAPPEEALRTYAVHSTARAALLRSRYGAPTDPLPAFGLSGCTCGRLGVNPDPARKFQLRKLFDRIIEAAEEQRDREHARILCRDAFSLVRTCMEANTAPRWCTYDEYVQFPLAVAVLAKQTKPDCWTYCEHEDAYELATKEEAPLYPAELAWLYNDIALALSGSGSIHDACTFWEQAYEICRLIEHPKEGGGFHLEVLLSIAFTFIEMGRLSAAGRQLDDAERLVREIPDDDFAARILGLRGLMLHLQGDLQGADELYDRCLKLLRSGANLRAQSIFLKHKADVKISTQEMEAADLLIRNSRALAESGVFPELVANARISEGHRLTRTGQAVKARLEYTAVLHEAQRIGYRKLEVRALTALARLALDQKDADGGRELAMRALSLANQLGLGLRQSHALVVLGLATLEMGQSDLGIAYLRSAKRLADDQGYWSRSREAENKLLELGVNLAYDN